MRIPINAAKSLLGLILEEEDPDVSAAVLRRLNTIDKDKDFLQESLAELSRVQDELFTQEPTATNWPGLSGEFSALLSWLMQDLKTSKKSVEFDKAALTANLRSLDNLGIKGPYPASLRLRVHHWVVGACWSIDGYGANALVFPLRALSLDKKQAGIAYNGLIRHLQTLEALGLEGDPEPDLEMLVSSIAIRVVGLGEALNPTIRDSAQTALSSQLAKFGAAGVKTEIKKEVESIWHNDALKDLVDARNSIAHVSSDRGRAFSETVVALSEERIQEITKLASTLMSAEILHTLHEVSEVKVLQWLNQFRSQLENQNLHPLVSSLPSGFRVEPVVGAANQTVTPLG